MDQRHVVLGASGGAGAAIVAALHGEGHRVRAVNRAGDMDAPSGVDRVGADVGTREGAARALAGADVAYLATQPPYHRWATEFPAMVSTVVAALPDGAKLVMVDNLYAYGPQPGPLSESTPERARDSKGRVRRDLADMLRQTHREGRVRVAVGRASDYLGGGATRSAVTALAIEPVASRRTLRWPVSLDVPHSVAYLPDIARGYVALGTHDEADGHVWILPHAPAVTGREFLRLVNDSLDEPMPTGVLSLWMLRLAAPFHRESREMLSIAYQWGQPFVVDHSRFDEAFGPMPATPLDDAVRATVGEALGRSHGRAR